MSRQNISTSSSGKPKLFITLGVSSLLVFIAARNAGNRFVVNAVVTALD